MSIDASIAAIASTADPRARWALIRLALGARQVTLGDIARRCRVARQAVSQTAYLPCQRVEQALAEALDCPPALLFPDRYSRDGRRTVITRTPPRARGQG